MDIKRLQHAFHLPPKYVGYNGTIANGMEAILLLLQRMVYPNRLCDLVKAGVNLKTEKIFDFFFPNYNSLTIGLTVIICSFAVFEVFPC